MSTNIFIDQALMMSAFTQTIDTFNPAQASLYLKLMVEEMGETLVAANPKAEPIINGLILALTQYAEIPDSENFDLVALFDGLLDVLVVTINCGISLRLPMIDGWNEVHATNMAKVDAATGKVIRRNDGKVLKPEGWEPPNLAKIIWEAEQKPRGHGFNTTETVGLVTSVPPAAEDSPLIAGLSLSDRYLNLALLHIGSCLTTIGNFRQQRKPAGPSYAEVGVGLLRAISALKGEIWESPVGNNEREALAELQAKAELIVKIPKRQIDKLPGQEDISTHQIAFNRGYNKALEEVTEIIIKGKAGAGS